MPYEIGRVIFPLLPAGKQFLMNMEGQWSLIWCMDGRFYERYDGPELNFEWAYDGNQSPWSADAAGRVSILDLDDREVGPIFAKNACSSCLVFLRIVIIRKGIHGCKDILCVLF